MTKTGLLTDGFWGALLEYNVLRACVKEMKEPEFERVLKNAKLIITKNPGQK
jgi:hypothetical protein